MKVIGLIGGISWESLAKYYQLVNEEIRDRLGGLNSAKLLMLSVNHQEIDELERQNRWTEAAVAMVDAARRLEKGGAAFVLICCNVMHKIADHVQRSIGVPLIHIADVTAEAVKRSGFSAVGLLGARAVMEEDFFKDNLVSAGLDVIIPSEAAREFVNGVIFNELSYGEIVEESKKMLLNIIKDLESAGAQCVVLGCTELSLLIQQEDTPLPLFDTLALHARKAVDLALED